MTTPTFDDWKLDQDVKYRLVVEVNDEQVFASDYATLDDLYEEGRKPEGAVEQKLEDEYNYLFEED